MTESSVGTGRVWKVRVWAQIVGPPASSKPHNRKEYDVVSASPVTFCENRPLAPPGKCDRSVCCVVPDPSLSQYSKYVVAGPLFAVPPAFKVALSGPTSVAGSVDP